MPRGDRTGPAYAGPMTGRRAGYCAGNPTPGYATAGAGYGGGRGSRGGGRGWRNWFYATGLPGWARMGAMPTYTPPSNEQQISVLKEQANLLQSQLETINKRISELESSQ